MDHDKTSGSECDVVMAWIFPLIVFLLTVGFAKQTIVVLNMWFARRLSKRTIALSQLINASAIAGYAIWLSRGPGSTSLRGFVRDAFDGNGIAYETLFCPSGGVILMLVLPGLVGLMLLVWSSVEFHLAASPSNQCSVETTRIDMRRRFTTASWKSELIGNGPMHRIAQLPANEQWQLDVVTRTFVMDRLPAEWDGLSLVHLSDLHFRGAVSRRYFELVCEEAGKLAPDVFMFSGDLLDNQSLQSWLPHTLGRLRAPLGCFFVLGNHDWYLDHTATRCELERLGWTGLGGQVQHVARLPVSDAGQSFEPLASSTILLSGDETPWMGDHPDLSNSPKEQFRILLSHTPDNIPWARVQGVDLMLAGHTHGGQIRPPLLGPIYSPSRFGTKYASGVFHLDPTLMCVSRGISGREPIRFGCPPELIKLVLRSRTLLNQQQP